MSPRRPISIPLIRKTPDVYGRFPSSWLPGPYASVIVPSTGFPGAMNVLVKVTRWAAAEHDRDQIHWCLSFGHALSADQFSVGPASTGRAPSQLPSV